MHFLIIELFNDSSGDEGFAIDLESEEGESCILTDKQFSIVITATFGEAILDFFLMVTEINNFLGVFFRDII